SGHARDAETRHPRAIELHAAPRWRGQANRVRDSAHLEGTDAFRYVAWIGSQPGWRHGTCRDQTARLVSAPASQGRTESGCENGAENRTENGTENGAENNAEIGCESRTENSAENGCESRTESAQEKLRTEQPTRSPGYNVISLYQPVMGTEHEIR